MHPEVQLYLPYLPSVLGKVLGTLGTLQDRIGFDGFDRTTCQQLDQQNILKNNIFIKVESKARELLQKSLNKRIA